MTDTVQPSATLTNVVPWGLHPVPKFVQDTLKKRPKAYAWHSATETDTAATRTAWARVCSNGKPKNNSGFEGFVLFGPNNDTSAGPVGFSETFGFVDSGMQVIGRDANNVPHVLKAVTFPYRPPPCLQSIEHEFYGAGSSFPGLCKRATIKWKCFSKEQLEYLTPYFLSLGVSAVIEWGWNNFSNSSLIDLTNAEKLIQMFKGGKSYYNRISDSNGDYDCHVGRIIDYGYKMDNQGNYEGYTVVVNPSFMFEGVNTKDQTGESKSGDGGSSSAVDFIKNRFDNLTASEEKLPKRFVGKEFILARLIQKNDWIFKRPDGKYPAIKPDVKFWINMRGLQAIFNLFGTVKYGDTHRDLSFRFSNAKIGAHPLIKAVGAGSDNKNVSVLIPNAFAPRLINGGSKPSKQSLKTISDTRVDKRFADDAKKLADALAAEELGLSDETDDLQSVIGSKNPFPMLVNGGIIQKDDPSVYRKPTTQQSSTETASPIPTEDDVYKSARPGYWGFLGDIYVSNTLVKTAFSQNDTLQRTLEYILGEISSAGSNVWEFRVIPDGPNNITVMDSAFCPIASGVDAKASNLVNFTIGKTEDSCFTDYSMNVQMKQEMATQTLLGQKSAVDASGRSKVHKFVSEDRLFNQPGSFEYADETEEEKKENKSKADAAAKAKAEFDATRKSNKGFVILQKDGDLYYLTEKDPELMKKIVSLSPNPLSSPMMPGTEFTFDCQGISGFAFLGMFTLSAVPKPYDYNNAVFQVDGVKSIIAENNWKTSITAKVRPLVVTSTQTTPSQ